MAMRLRIHDITESKIIYNQEYAFPIPRVGETISFINETGSHQYLIKSIDWVFDLQKEISATIKVVEY